MGYYAEYDTIKKKMRIPDDSLKDELQIYITEVEELIDNRLRNRLGSFDEKGREITLPLTTSTKPAIDNELKAIAHDMVEGKFRLKTSEKPMLWDSAIKAFDNYLDRRFGWASAEPYRVKPTISISPTSGSAGTTITVSGDDFVPSATITITIGGSEADTTPTSVVSDSDGSFSSVTFAVPSTFSAGVYQVKCHDNDITDRTQRDPDVKYSGAMKRFTVT